MERKEGSEDENEQNEGGKEDGKLGNGVKMARKEGRKMRRVGIEDVAEALREKGIKQVIGIGKETQYKQLKNEKNVLAPVEKYLVLETFLNTPMQAISAQPSMTIHWLAIDGVQPRIAANPAVEETDETNKVTKKLKSADTVEVEISSVEAHILTKEQRAYLDYVTQSLNANENTDSIFATLLADAGLQALVPFLSRFFVCQVRDAISSLTSMKAAVQLVLTLCKSPHVNLEFNLPQIIPALLSVLLGRDSGADFPLGSKDSHFLLRSVVSEALHLIYAKFGYKYSHLFSRIFKTLVTVLSDVSKSLQTHYGAIVGLFCFSPIITRTIVLPFMPIYLIELANTRKIQDSHEARFCYQAVLVGYGEFLKLELLAKGYIDPLEFKVPDFLKTRENVLIADVHLFFKEYFGEHLLPYLAAVQEK